MWYNQRQIISHADLNEKSVHLFQIIIESQFQWILFLSGTGKIYFDVLVGTCSYTKDRWPFKKETCLVVTPGFLLRRVIKKHKLLHVCP